MYGKLNIFGFRLFVRQKCFFHVPEVYSQNLLISNGANNKIRCLAGRREGRKQMGTWQSIKHDILSSFVRWTVQKFGSQKLTLLIPADDVRGINRCQNCGLTNWFWIVWLYWIINFKKDLDFHWLIGGLQLPKISKIFPVDYTFEDIAVFLDNQISMGCCVPVGLLPWAQNTEISRSDWLLGCGL